MGTMIIIAVIVFALLILLPSTIKIVKQYEAGVVFRLGRLEGTRAPGIRFIIPFVDVMRKIDTRIVTMDVPSQEAITRDNVTVKVDAVVYFRVIHPEASIIEVENYAQATFMIGQTTLRSVLGQSTLDELLAERDKINQTLRRIIDEHTDPWGIKVTAVEVKAVELPQGMQRAIAAQAEAERTRRAKVIHAEGEFQAAKTLSAAGKTLAEEPMALQLRYLQTLTEIATEKNSTIIFPLPIDLISMFMNRGTQGQGGTKAGS